MSNRIRPDQLQAGDVLLYHGTSLISDLIRLFDGGNYSHASIWNGKQIVEALGQGITENSVPASTAGAKFVDVYRFVAQDREKLGDTNYPAQPVLSRIAWYVANPQRYAYEEILLLAVLASTRQIPVVSWIPGLNLIIRNVLDRAADLLARLAAGNKEPVICSELVYRCYAEADATGKYHLAIRGADTLAAARAAEVQAAILGSPGLAPAAILAVGPLSDPLLPEKQEFLARYAALKGKPPATMASIAAARAAGAAAAAAVADFVTPHDLERSPNLYQAGTLVLQ